MQVLGHLLKPVKRAFRGELFLNTKDRELYEVGFLSHGCISTLMILFGGGAGLSWWAWPSR